MQQIARSIIENTFAKRVATINRFPTGLSHFVFDVVTDDNFPCVVRVARPERREEFERGLYWQDKLERIGIPLPEIYHTGEVNNHPFIICERVPGVDLENAYPSLTAPEKKEIAHSVAKIQQKIHSLDSRLFKRIYPWVDVLQWIVDRTEAEILANGLCDGRYVGLVREQIQTHTNYLNTIEPAPFLYDLNVRNVIVQSGQVTGIIDVDDLWFGDPLLAIGRGKTILLMMQQDTDFISHWRQYLNLSPLQLKMVDFYALLYAVRFMGTIGQKLNGNASIQTDPNMAHLLQNIAEDMLTRL